MQKYGTIAKPYNPSKIIRWFRLPKLIVSCEATADSLDIMSGRRRSSDHQKVVSCQITCYSHRHIMDTLLTTYQKSGLATHVRLQSKFQNMKFGSDESLKDFVVKFENYYHMVVVVR